MKTKNVIVIAFNGDRNDSKIQMQSNLQTSKSNFVSLTVNSVHTAQPLSRNIYSPFSSKSSFLINQTKLKQIEPIVEKDIKQEYLHMLASENEIGAHKSSQQVEKVQLNEKQKKSKKNKNKSDFQIKNVLQQICSSIQNCLKDEFIQQLTLQYWQDSNQSKLNTATQNTNKLMIQKMQNYLNNPSEHNIGCLLRMVGEVHNGFQRMFRSRVLKKYIQCSKIRTLKQKTICLEAVDYLYRCFKQQQLCSLHTWAHKRQQKIQNRRIERLKIRQKSNSSK